MTRRERKWIVYLDQSTEQLNCAETQLQHVGTAVGVARITRNWQGWRWKAVELETPGGSSVERNGETYYLHGFIYL
eukprot:8527131-Pyramimonas_sp.AAC.1